MSLHPAAAPLAGLEQRAMGSGRTGEDGRRDEDREESLLPDVNLMLRQQGSAANSTGGYQQQH
jgi:hypothetical protein